MTTTEFVPKMMLGTAGDFQMARDEKHEAQLRQNGYIDSPDPGHIKARQEAEQKKNAPEDSNVKQMPKAEEEDNEPGTKPRKRA